MSAVPTLAGVEPVSRQANQNVSQTTSADGMVLPPASAAFPSASSFPTSMPVSRSAVRPAR